MKRHIVLVLAAATFLSGGAMAHVTAAPDTAKSGSYGVTNFTVPHGCAGAATVAVRIKLPDGVGDVKPQQKPGWTVEIVTRKLAVASRDEHGNAVTEAVAEVDWRGGKLPDTLYDTFGLLMRLPDQPGATLYFPTVQECEQGVHRWIEIPAAGQQWHDLDQPAPFVKLTP
jgi:periplasmic copper chaperone A